MCVVVLQSIAASGSGFFGVKISFFFFLYIKLPCCSLTIYHFIYTSALHKSTLSFDVSVVTLIGKHCQVTVNTKPICYLVHPK